MAFIYIYIFQLDNKQNKISKKQVEKIGQKNRLKNRLEKNDREINFENINKKGNLTYLA